VCARLEVTGQFDQFLAILGILRFGRDPAQLFDAFL
jgi:hypothetical protein